MRSMQDFSVRTRLLNYVDSKEVAEMTTRRACDSRGIDASCSFANATGDSATQETLTTDDLRRTCTINASPRRLAVIIAG